MQRRLVRLDVVRALELVGAEMLAHPCDEDEAARTMSTSPWPGQFSSLTSQAAGQVPQPCGICLMSKL